MADDTNVWGNSSVTIDSTVFSLGDYNGTNGNGDSMVAYCFTPIEGYSQFGTYEGYAAADGAYVITGFRPAWLMCRNLDSAGSWIIFDNKRQGFNFDNHHVMADTNAAEADDSDIELMSNGFKCRRSSTSFNSNHSFVYMAFAEQPFKYANAR